MSVDRDEVARIATLAKLRLDDDETDRLTAEMNRILEHAERLRTLALEATDGATDRTVATTKGARAPEAEAPDPLQWAPASFAPDMREGFFVVPPPPGVVAPGVDDLPPGGRRVDEGRSGADPEGAGTDRP